MSDQIHDSEVQAGEAGFEVSPGVGAQLRAAREARGIPLDELAGILKLGARQVEALENGDWQALPGHTFVRGFIRNYARLVHIDPAPLMAQLDATLEKPVSRLGEGEVKQAPMPHGGSGISRRDRAVVMTGGALVLLAGLVYLLLPNDLSSLRNNVQGLLDSLSHKEAPAEPAATPAAEPVFPPGSTPQQVMNPQAEMPAAAPAAAEAPAGPAPAPAAPEPAAAPAPLAPPAAPPPPAVDKTAPVANASPLRFVFDKESWVEVRDRGNKVIFSQRSAAGSEQSVSGSGPYSLVIGYAPGVKLFWRGQPVDLVPHTRGDVARLVLE